MPFWLSLGACEPFHISHNLSLCREKQVGLEQSAVFRVAFYKSPLTAITPGEGAQRQVGGDCFPQRLLELAMRGMCCL